MFLSPAAKEIMMGGDDSEEEAVADDLVTWTERTPSEESLMALLLSCIEEGGFMDELGLVTLAASCTHPRELNSEAWEILKKLSREAAAINTRTGTILKSCVKNWAVLFKVDFTAALAFLDTFVVDSSFSLVNDNNEPIPSFLFVSLIASIKEVDEATSAHSKAKTNKDRICLLLKLIIDAVNSQFVKLCAHSVMKTPAKSLIMSSESDPRLQEMEYTVTKLTSDFEAFTMSSNRITAGLTKELEQNSRLVACLVAQLQQANISSVDSKSLSSSDSVIVVPSMTKVGTVMSPAESLAESCVGGVVTSLTTTDVKGTESDDNLMSCMFVSGEKPQTARRKPQFLDNYNSLHKFIENSKGFFPRISVESVTVTKGESTDLSRTVFKAGIASVARRVDYLPVYGTAATSTMKLAKYKVALTSHEGLPSSLSHMVKMLYDDLEELRVFSDFLPREMDALVEREIGRFVSLMSSLWVSLVDSSDTTVCFSHEGIWRGLIHLFYHQYMDAFSGSERGLFQTFYPEMLCKSFDVNSAYLLRHYSWRSSQLTGSVHNYIRSSCPRCMQSKLSASCCITASCVKSREEEALLHVFINANGKPQANPFKA
jgi:hypothetical protein